MIIICAVCLDSGFVGGHPMPGQPWPEFCDCTRGEAAAAQARAEEWIAAAEGEVEPW